MFDFPKGKSHGGDGVPYEFIQDSRSLVKDGCREMVQDFWRDAKLTPNIVNGIVKMVPQGSEELEIVDNWRNLTMLTMTYKIILKILTKRLKPMVPKLVDRQQIGFISGRCIIDNLLAWKMGQEHARVMLQDIAFLKLDFAKACNRINHNFLWATLTTMRLDPWVIQLI